MGAEAYTRSRTRLRLSCATVLLPLNQLAASSQGSMVSSTAILGRYQADFRIWMYDSISSLQCCSDVCDLKICFVGIVIDPLVHVAKWFAW